MVVTDGVVFVSDSVTLTTSDYQHFAQVVNVGETHHESTYWFCTVVKILHQNNVKRSQGIVVTVMWKVSYFISYYSADSIKHCHIFLYGRKIVVPSQ